MESKIGLIKYEIEHPNQDAVTCYRLVKNVEKDIKYFSDKIKAQFPKSYLHSIELLPILD